VHGLGAAVPIHVAAVCVWTIGEILRSGVSSSLVAALAPADARGRYNGVWVMSWGFASSLGPLVGARVLATWGPHVLWPGCLALAVIVAGAFLATAGPRRRRLATAP
jgi:MFS family permease